MDSEFQEFFIPVWPKGDLLTKHLITKEYKQLKGFSTDSIFKRPPFVAELDINMQRLPDGTFAPRRGYQAQTANIGGLGVSIFHNRVTNEIQDISINSDGNLYKKLKGTLTITFNGLDKYEYVAYEIYVDPTVSSDTQTARFDPFSVVAQNALVTDSINFKFGKVNSFTAIAIGNASNTYTGILGGYPIQPGSIIMTDGTLTIVDDPSGSTGLGTFTGNIGVGTNTINYSTGAYTVTFSGVTGPVKASYRSQLITQFNQPMGKGFGVASPFLISTLVGQLSSILGVSVTTTGQTSWPGAFLEVSEVTNIANGLSMTLDFFYWVSTNRTLAVTFPGLLASLNTPEFINATFAAYQEVIYIGNAHDPVQKFDGQTVYRAGMPNGVSPVLTNLGGGNVDTGVHEYFITYEQIDATGRLVEGVISDPAPITLVGNSEIQVEVTNLLQGSGWNTNAAIISAPQAGVNTINVNAGQTLQVGDSAFFIDAAGNPQTRLILSRTAGSITIDGAPVSVTNATAWQAVISNNLKINIYRTKANGTEPFPVISIPNNSYATTTKYIDNVTDASIPDTSQFIIPVRRHDPPPQVAVVFPFKNVMIYTADPFNDDFVWYSDPDQPEYVGQVQSEQNEPNRFIVPSNADDVIGAGVAGSTLVIFKNLSIYAVSGEIATEQFTVIAVAQGSNIGCVAHATICSVGGLLYFLHTNGIYSMSESNIFPTDQFGNPIPLTIPIDSFFRTQITQQADQQFQLIRAVAVNYTKDNQYLLFLPAEETKGPRAANDNSRILCYDYQGKNYFEWTNINAAGGLYVNGDNLYWQERRISQSGGITANTYKQHRKYILIDQADHVTSIRVTWVSSWEDLGQPRVRKKFVRAALLFDVISSKFQTNLPALYFFSCLDWNTGVIDTEAIVTTEIEGNPWSISDWDWTTWAAYQDTFLTVPLKNGTVTKSIQIGLQLNQLNTSFSLQGFQIEIAPDFRRTIIR